MFGNKIQGLKFLRFLITRKNIRGRWTEPFLLILGIFILIFFQPNHAKGQFSDGYFNIPALTCSFEPEFPADSTNFNIRLDKEFEADVPGFVNPFVIDINGDGSPEVVTLGTRDIRGHIPTDAAPRITKNILIFNGQTGGLIRSISTPYLSYEGTMPIAMADILPHPGVEIVVATSHVPITASPSGSFGNLEEDRGVLIIYGSDGTFLGRSTEKYGVNTPNLNPCDPATQSAVSGAAPGLADFNNDGRSEIYIYNEIFNDNLLKLGDGGAFGQGIGFSNFKTGTVASLIGKSGESPALSVAANFDSDINLELAAGNTLYNVQINNANSPGGAVMTPIELNDPVFGQRARDGFTSIADIDLDGEFDIVVTTSKITQDLIDDFPCLGGVEPRRHVYVWNPTKGLIASALLEQVDKTFIDFGFTNPLEDPQFRTGVAFIGDVNSDGNPNIGVTSPENVEMFEYVNGSQTLDRLWRLPTSDRSGMTMITMFDFNQDGSQEIVYRDETTLRIINGEGGAPTFLTSILVPSATALEGAIVADVDGDGEAEILTVKAKNPDPTDILIGELIGRIEVFKSDGLPWAPARAIWNQHAYFNINVLDDRSIPREIPKPSDLAISNSPCGGADGVARPLNNFLVQSTFFNEEGCPTVNIGAMDATIEILEANYTCIPGEIEVDFIVSNISPDQVIPNTLEVAFFDTFFDENDPSLNFIQSVITGIEISTESTSPVLSVTLSGAPPNNTLNPQTLVAIANNDGTTTFDPIPECDFTNNEDNIQVIPQPVFVILNDQGDICSYEEITLVPENQSENSVESDILWFQIDGSGNRIPISNGSNIGGAIHTIAPDPDFTLTITNLAPGSYTYEIEVGCTGATDQVSFEVFPAPEPIFDSNPVLCFGESTGEIFVTSGGSANYQYELIETGEVNGTGVFDQLAAGTYTIQVNNLSNPTSCFQTFDIEVTQPIAALEAQVLDLKNETCELDNGSAVVAISGGTVGSGYQFVSLALDGSVLSSPTFSNSGDEFTFTNLADGDYTSVFEDQNGCTVSTQFTIESLPIPEFDVQDVEICEGELAVLVPELISGQPESIQYSWYLEQTGGTPLSNGQTLGDLIFGIDTTTGELQITGIPFVDSPLTVYLDVSGDGVCPLSDRIAAEVTLFELALPTIVSSTSPLCFGDVTGEITFDVGNKTVADYEFQVDGGAFQDSPTFSGLAVGDYTLNVRDRDNGCISSLAFTIDQPDEIVGTIIDLISASCAQENGLINIEVSGGTLIAGAEYRIELDGLTQTQLGDRFSLISENNFSVSELSPGTHVLEFFDSNGCRGELTFEVNDLEIPEFDVQDAGICEGDLAGTLRPVIVNLANSTPNFSWSYEDPINSGTYISINSGDVINGAVHTISNGELTIEGLPGSTDPYIYYLEVSGDLVCPADPIPAEFTVKVLPTVIFDIKQVTCLDGSNGAITASPEFAGASYEFSFESGAFSSVSTWSGLSAGIYNISARDIDGCISNFQIEVQEPVDLIQINTPSLIRSSCDLPNGSIENLQITGGWGEYDVSWNFGSPTGSVVNGGLEGASNLFPGEYFLTVRDILGCEEIFSFIIEESSDPEYQLVPNQDVCFGEPVEIRPIHIAPDPSLPPAAPTEVRWYKSSSQQDEIVDGADPQNPSINYTIDDSDWLNPRLLIEGLPAGTHDFYFYVVCTGIEIETSITVFPIPDVSYQTLSVSCYDSEDGKIIVDEGSEPNFLYSVNGGAELTQSELEALDFGPGTYNLIVSQNGVGCASESQFVEILRPDSPLAILNLSKDDPACGASNGIIRGTIGGGWPGYSVSLLQSGTVQQTLNSSDGDFVFSGLLPGSFTLEVEDARSCIIQSSEIILEPGPTRILIDDVEICEGEEARLTPILDPPAPGAQVLWYFDAAKSQPINSSASPSPDGKIYQISADGELSITGLDFTDSPINYYVEVTGGGSCTGFIASPRVIVNNSPEMVIDVEDVNCFGEKGSIFITPSEGTGNFTYSLDGVNFGSDNSFVVDPGVYQVFVESGGCVISQTNVIVEGPDSALTLTLLSEDQPDCNSNNGRFEFKILGGYGPDYTVELFKDGSLSETLTLTSSSLLIDNLKDGTYQIRVSDGFCTIESEIYQLIPNPSDIEVLPEIVCEGEEIQLLPQINQAGVIPKWTWYRDVAGTDVITSGSSDGAATYTIQQDGALSISGLPASNEQYIFYLGVSGENICPPSLLPVSVNVNPIPNLRVSNPSVVCDPEGTVDLTQFIEGFNSEIFDYRIESPSGPMRVEEIDQVDMSGDYIVSSSYKDMNCFSPNQRIRVLISDEELIPEFQYVADLGGGNLLPNQQAQIFEDVIFEDLSQGKVIIWNWDFGDGNSSNEQNPIHQFGTKGLFTVTLTTVDEFGCVAEYSRTIEILDDYLVMIPNAFTPNAAKNQFFKPKYRGIVSMEFYIFNNWGELIFQTNSLETLGWDGTLNGTAVQNGNYVYRATFITRSGEKLDRSGVFVLIR